MLDPAIEKFLSERKAAWLKDRLKANQTDDEQRDTEEQAREKFDLNNWLPDAARRSSWLSMQTHPSKFTHPSAKTSAVLAQPQSRVDGFLRTGNVTVEFDVLGAASAIDVFKFLSLTLIDGQTVLAHLEQNSASIQTQFQLATASFDEIRDGLLTIKAVSTKAKTSEKIKQVYFLVDENYHLLSLLTPSGLVFKLKEKINHLRFSEEAKQAREDRKANKENEHGFSELYGLTVIGFGGTKPQNISVLNSQNGGTAYLLSSQPPPLDLNYLRRPKANFFEECLYKLDYLDDFKAFQKPLKDEWGKPYEQKEERDEAIVALVDSVMEKVWHYRQLEPNWTKDSPLSNAQKIWLDSFYENTREEEDEWLDEIVNAFAKWFRVAYEKTLGKKAIHLDDIDLNYIFNEIEACAEDLR